MKINKIGFLGILLVLGFLLAFWGTSASQAANLSPALEQALSAMGPDEEISIIITLNGKPDIAAFKNLPRDLKRTAIVSALRDAADRNLPPLQAFLQSRGGKDIRKLWIIHGIAVKLGADAIRGLAALPGVESIRLDHTLQAPGPVETLSVTPEWNLTSVQAPELWGLGYTGAGVVVAAMDTGVDLNHPDLMFKYRGGANSWYDPNGEHPTPDDASGHGTQVMGVIVGGDAGGTAIGVAPGAQWIAAKVFNDAGQTYYSAIHLSFQWLLDPDSIPASNDAPDVVNISWGLGNVNDCDTEFQPDVAALTTAGIAVVFAAGNSGPNPSTSISPGNLPGAFAVGAVNQFNNIYTYSSRGPCACDGTIYPDMTAPGVSIRTSSLTYGGAFPNSYATVSGTSVAAPHAAGSMALLLSAFPSLTIAELEETLKASALDLGSAGADNTYGYGLLKAKDAYDGLSAGTGPEVSATPPSKNYGEIEIGYASVQAFTITNISDNGVVLGNAVISPGNPAEFIIQNDSCSGITLISSASCTLEVSFVPGSEGAKTAGLLIPYTSSTESALEVPLSGTGVRLNRITVASPNGGESWKTGTTQTIRWTYTGNPGSYVKIHLYKGGVLNKTIASKVSKGTNGAGSYRWKIPVKTTPGDDYKIKITSTSNASYTDMSDNNFRIFK